MDSVSQTGKDEKVFYIVYRLDGKQIEERVGRSIRDDMTPAKAARIRADRIERRELSNEAKREQARADKERPTIAHLWEEYISQKTIKGFATDEGRFRNYLLPAFGDKEPQEIDQLSVARLKTRILKTRTAQTVKNTLELLRRIVNFGVDANRCEPLPFKIVFPKVNNLVTEDLKPGELQALLQAIDQDLHPVAGPMMLCALFTGMRRGEMFRLEWKDLDFERGFIHLRDPKGGTDQTIPMSESARGLFSSLERTSEHVFPGRDGGQRTDITKAVKRIARKAGLPGDFRPLHGLRHTYASMLASSGKVDMYTLQKLLTHKSPDMTQRYAHLRDEAMQRATGVVDDIFSQVR
ncbi:hypothetical protein MASR1M90_14590 [Desulfovibrionales bacterium]